MRNPPRRRRWTTPDIWYQDSRLEAPTRIEHGHRIVEKRVGK